MKFTYTKNLTIEKILNHAGIYAGSNSSHYYQKRYDSVSKKNAYYVTVPNKYRYHLGITESNLFNCLATMNDTDWLFLSNAMNFELDFVDLWHILYVLKTNHSDWYFLTDKGRAILKDLNLGSYIIESLDDAWNLANSGMTWADMNQAHQAQFARNYDMLMGYLALACVSAVNNVYRPPVKSGGNPAKFGDKFGKMGTYVKHPGTKVDWSKYAEHGYGQLAERGMSKELVDSIVKNGKALSQNAGAKYAFVTKEGVAVVAANGKLITAWSEAYFDAPMKAIVKSLFGG